jgi:hypothetical protein
MMRFALSGGKTLVVADLRIAIRAVGQRNFPVLVKTIQPKACANVRHQRTTALTVSLSQGSIAQTLQHSFQGLDELIMSADARSGGH